jgi:hypothetical protein
MKKSTIWPFTSILSFAMGAVYIGGGIFLVASSKILEVLPTEHPLQIYITAFLAEHWQRYTFGVMLIAYGIFRIYRGLKQHGN